MEPIPPFTLNLRSYGLQADEHRHDHAQLVLPLAGRLLLDIGGRERLLGQGQGAFVETGMRHTQVAHERNRALILDLDPHQVPLPLLERLAARPFLPIAPAAWRLVDYMGLVLQGGPATTGQLQHWVPLLLDQLAQQAPRAVSRLTALLARVQASPEAAWSAERMAQQACLSTSRLHALFRSELGTTPAAWLQQMRLDRVRDWLVTTDRPIAELALAAGYADQNALTRAMRRATGSTPAALRRAARGSA
ncbi:AraC family transcriptional regulator [Pseudorhodoferax sp.]|uniref:AraC family transcriptional regulator n=1 Tax=Pseudorhodoferax sp. TaxID=1993553 RepID=UPI002DD63089|nr:AraC family transcriptional regulator [Pseudorhodoferax sp.]